MGGFTTSQTSYVHLSDRERNLFLYWSLAADLSLWSVAIHQYTRYVRAPAYAAKTRTGKVLGAAGFLAWVGLAEMTLGIPLPDLVPEEGDRHLAAPYGLTGMIMGWANYRAFERKLRSIDSQSSPSSPG